ncbi:MAG: hypothetical protein M1827_004896 [Pycnora praestabilis]|nr:MAG: hypothetical protein M1827_004896 [Pycnora praestabilis]
MARGPTSRKQTLVRAPGGAKHISALANPHNGDSRHSPSHSPVPSNHGSADDESFLERLSSSVNQLERRAQQSGVEFSRLKENLEVVEKSYKRQKNDLKALRALVAEQLEGSAKDSLTTTQSETLRGDVEGDNENVGEGVDLASEHGDAEDDRRCNGPGSDYEGELHYKKDAAQGTMKPSHSLRDGDGEGLAAHQPCIEQSTMTDDHTVPEPRKKPLIADIKQGNDDEFSLQQKHMVLDPPDVFNGKNSPSSDPEALQGPPKVHRKHNAKRSNISTGRTLSISSRTSHALRKKSEAPASVDTPQIFPHDKPIKKPTGASYDPALYAIYLATLPAGASSSTRPTKPSAITSSIRSTDHGPGKIPLAQTVEEAVASLPSPPETRIPNRSVIFPNSYIEKALGGSGASFVKVSSKKIPSQVFECPEMIRVNPEMHGHGPSPGQHGALTLVKGQDMEGVVGTSYPTFRKSDGGWVYCGQYKLSHRIVVPLEVWNDWQDGFKLGIAKKIDTTAWGQDLLLRSNVTSEEDLQSVTVEHILEYFSREKKPYLRMSWAVLQCIGYYRDHYDALKRAMPDNKRLKALDSSDDTPLGHNQEKPVTENTTTLDLDAKTTKSRSADQSTIHAKLPAVHRPQKQPSKRPHTPLVSHSPPFKTPPTKELSSSAVNGPDAAAAAAAAAALPESDPESEENPPKRRRRADRKSNTVRIPSTPEEPKDDQGKEVGVVAPESRGSERGKRARKSVDYRLVVPELDEVIFGEDDND